MAAIYNKLKLKATVITIIVMSLCVIGNAQTVNAVLAEGSASSKHGPFQDIPGADVAIDVTGVDYVLITASFMASMLAPEEAERVAEFRIVDKEAEELINSGIIHRSFSHQKKEDFGLGSIVYIFDVSAVSGTKVYKFQQRFDYPSRSIDTEVSMTAMALNGSGYDLMNDCKSISAPLEMLDSVWSPIPDLTTDVFVTPGWGGFYVAASLDCLTQSFNTEAIAEYKIQYKVNNEPWEDMTSVVNRSMVNSNDYGIINLLGYLPDKTPPGDYSFRVMHQNISTQSDILTMGGNLVAVHLGNNTTYFPLILGQTEGVETTSDSFSPVLDVDITYEQNTDAYLHSQFTMQADSTTVPVFDLYVEGKLDSRDVSRTLEDENEIGVGVLTGVVTGLIAFENYHVQLRHLVIPPGNTLVSSANLVGFYLTAKENLLPVDLLYFKVSESNSTYNLLTWETVSEKSNDFFTISQSTDGDSWSPILQIPGCGDSYRSVIYEQEVTRFSSGKCYYKLTQTDYNGTSRDLSVVVADSKKDDKETILSVFPNPVCNTIYLEPTIPGEASVQVFDISGQVQLKIHGTLENGLDVSKLRKGSYILIIDDAEPIIFEKQ